MAIHTLFSNNIVLSVKDIIQWRFDFVTKFLFIIFYPFFAMNYRYLATKNILFADITCCHRKLIFGDDNMLSGKISFVIVAENWYLATIICDRQQKYSSTPNRRRTGDKNGFVAEYIWRRFSDFMRQILALRKIIFVVVYMKLNFLLSIV